MKADLLLALSVFVRALKFEDTPHGVEFLDAVSDKSDHQPLGKACEMASLQEAEDADGQKTKKLNIIAAKLVELVRSEPVCERPNMT